MSRRGGGRGEGKRWCCEDGNGPSARCFFEAAVKVHVTFAAVFVTHRHASKQTTKQHKQTTHVRVRTVVCTRIGGGSDCRGLPRHRPGTHFPQNVYPTTNDSNCEPRHLRVRDSQLSTRTHPLAHALPLLIPPLFPSIPTPSIHSFLHLFPSLHHPHHTIHSTVGTA